MMNDKFDKILSNKIKETLSTREVQYNPEHWAMLLAQKKYKKRRVLFLWRFAGVVALLIMVGITGEILIPNSDSYQNNEIALIGEEPRNKKREKRYVLDINNNNNSGI